MVLLKISMSRLLQSCQMFKRMTRRSLKMDGTRYYCSINVYIYFLVNPCGTRGCGYWWVWVRVALGIPKGYPCLSLILLQMLLGPNTVTAHGATNTKSESEQSMPYKQKRKT